MQTRKLVLLKLAVIGATAVVAVGGFFGFSNNFEKVKASAQGPTPAHTGAPGEANCTACHSESPVNSGTGNVVINGIPASYRPGQQVPVTVTVSQETGVVYGFQFTAVDNSGRQAGTFTLANTQQTQIADGIVNGNMRRYVEHTVDGIIPTQFGSKTWNFTWTAPATRVGRVSFHVAGNAANSDGSTNGDNIYTTSRNSFTGTNISSFDGDAKSDFAVFRPSAGAWYSVNTTNNQFVAVGFGINGDKIVPGDYDGDGKTDYAVFRPSAGAWFLQRSTAGFAGVNFGTSGDIPVSGDFDGDLKTDIAVYRPSAGAWYISRSSDGQFVAVNFGANGDKPVPGDYDADGRTDVAVWRPSDGAWYIQRSTAGFTATQFGANGDRPVQADYDGDGKTDIGVYRPSAGSWYLLQSTAGFSAVQFGASTDRPAPADFDGDGKTDIVVFRPANGAWYLLLSTGGFTAVNFGANGDIPVPAGYLAE